MTSDHDMRPPHTHRELRVRVKPSTSAPGLVDGAWWPWSTDPAAEFPALVMAMSSWVGPVAHLDYHLGDWGPAESTLIVENWAVRLAGSRAIPANTVVATGPNLKQIRLLVVPPATPGGAARAVLRAASRPGTVATVEEILASNGVSPGERPNTGPSPMTLPIYTTEPDISRRNDAICAMCPHLWRNHDQIALRYCTATARSSDASSRGCVCTTKEN